MHLLNAFDMFNFNCCIIRSMYCLLKHVTAAEQLLKTKSHHNRNNFLSDSIQLLSVLTELDWS